jgi:hypothetical protein
VRWPAVRCAGSASSPSVGVAREIVTIASGENHGEATLLAVTGEGLVAI